MLLDAALGSEESGLPPAGIVSLSGCRIHWGKLVCSSSVLDW